MCALDLASLTSTAAALHCRPPPRSISNNGPAVVWGGCWGTTGTAPGLQVMGEERAWTGAARPVRPATLCAYEVVEAPMRVAAHLRGVDFPREIIAVLLHAAAQIRHCDGDSGVESRPCLLQAQPQAWLYPSLSCVLGSSKQSGKGTNLWGSSTKQRWPLIGAVLQLTSWSSGPVLIGLPKGCPSCGSVGQWIQKRYLDAENTTGCWESRGSNRAVE
eukprot:354470-Chlamydomonas_euryale.AAC.32